MSHALLPARAMMRPTHLVVLDDRSAVVSHQDLRAAARPQNVLAYYSMRLCAGFGRAFVPRRWRARLCARANGVRCRGGRRWRRRQWGLEYLRVSV